MRRRDRESERISRTNSSRRRFTGDGAGRPNRRHSSVTESEMSPLGGSNPELALHSVPRPPDFTHGSRMDVTAANTAANAAGLPAPPPLPASAMRRDSSGSDAYTSVSGSRHDRHRVAEGTAAAGLAGAALGAAAERQRRRTSSSRRRDSSENTSEGGPRASVQVKMHNDGRHVTLRRLDANERAADRARKQSRPGRSGSISSAGGAGASGDEHWRRVERQERSPVY